MRTSILRATTLALALALGLSAARAGEEKRIAVVAKGSATQTADSVEVEFSVTARAETAADAEKSFRDRLAQVEEAIKEGEAKAPRPKRPAPKPQPPADEDEAPKKKKPAPPKKPKADEDDEDEAPAPKKKPAPADEEKPAEKKPAEEKKHEKKSDDVTAVPIALSERGFTLGVKGSKGDDNPMAKIMARQMGGAPEKTDSPMVAGCKVVVTIKNVKTLDRTLLARRIAQLIDVAIEAGADGADGDAPVVHFMADHEALRAAAYKEAVAKAKARATELATAAGITLGGVVGVQETQATGVVDTTGMQERMTAALFGMKTKEGVPLPTLDVGTDVELRVEFEIK